MNWIKEGINGIVDLEIMKLLTWEELEIRACGHSEITTKQLKEITKYSGFSSTHPMAKMFWEMFDSLN